MKKTKIVCSIGPASSNYEPFKAMAFAGVNVARVNFSHDTIEERENVMELVRKTNEETNLNIDLLFDTKGPEFRSGEAKEDKIIITGSIPITNEGRITNFIKIEEIN